MKMLLDLPEDLSVWLVEAAKRDHRSRCNFVLHALATLKERQETGQSAK
jgi:hypothetical protein